MLCYDWEPGTAGAHDDNGLGAGSWEAGGWGRLGTGTLLRERPRVWHLWRKLPRLRLGPGKQGDDSDDNATDAMMDFLCAQRVGVPVRQVRALVGTERAVHRPRQLEQELSSPLVEALPPPVLSQPSSMLSVGWGLTSS